MPYYLSHQVAGARVIGLEDVKERLAQVADPVALLVGLFANAPVGLQIYRADGHCLLTNQAFRDIFGGEPPAEYNIFDDHLLARDGALELTRRAFRGESITMPAVWYDSRDQPLRQGPGRRCAVICTAFPLFDARGGIGHVALVFKDVTAEFLAREQAEAERDLLRQTQSRLQAFLDNAPAVVFVKTLDGKHLLVSREARRALGIDLDGVGGATAADLFGSPYAEVSAANERQVLERREPMQAVEALPTVQGIRQFLLTRFPILGESGEPTALGGIAIDISERKQAEEQLRRSEQRFSQVFHALPMAALFSRMSDRRFVDVNDAWERLTGFTRDELLGTTSIELGLWSDPSQREELFQALAERGFVRDFEARLRQKSGSLRDVLLSVDRIELAGEDCLLLLARDVTELRRLERELRQAQKMEAIGRLAGGVAHDFNNILTAISGAGTLLLDGLGPAHPLRRYAEQIKRSTTRAAALTRQLLTFTRKQPLQPVVLDPNEAVRATLEMLQRMIGADIELRAELGARGRVKADPGSIEQVLMNLAVNARDAMPTGGTLLLRTADIDGGDGVPGGAWVLLAVTDTGVGMDAQMRTHLFEPFFTTKEQGKGTGLGLSTVYGIIQQIGGHILVDSEPGRGSNFKVYLPRERELEPPAIEPSAAGAEAPTGGRETILLVEDDEGVRDFVRFVLSTLGYRVLEAGDGAEALRVASGFAEPIDLLLSDIVMPRLGGLELARQLVQLRPTMKVMHMSGYPGDSAETRAVTGGRARLLAKPFERDTLAQHVRGILDDRL